ncbi:hypothetical protein ACEXQE_07995 [Herbiconiux sp. P17]|uniref:hypothetical protein n=1 Tax=Herbiconiux wuyangfengii TaxID=3342794 RepID=UPI0035B709BC
MIRRTTSTIETVVALDGSVVLPAVGGAVGALVVGLLVLLVVLSVRRGRRRAAKGRAEKSRAEKNGRPAGGSDYSAGIARVPTTGDGRGRRAAARLFGAPERIIGLDIARGAALAMLVAVTWFGSTRSGAEAAENLVAIVGPGAGRDPSDALATGGAVAGLALVLISGVAVALSSGGATPADGVERLRFRMRLAVRAIMLLGIGGVAAFSGSPFAGLVATIGALSLVALAVLGWRASALFLAAALWTVAVPALASALAPLVENSRTLIAPPLEWALTGEFPPVPLVGVFVAGVAVGRLDLTRIGRRWIVFAAAIGCATLAFGAGALVSARLGDSMPEALSSAPGSMAPLALLGTGGAALALVSLALIVGRVLRWPLVLLSAAGSMALTLWLASLAAIGATWAVAQSAASQGSEAVFATLPGAGPIASLARSVPDAFRAGGIVAAFIVLAAVGCVVWRLLLGDGPAERLLRRIGKAATGVPELSGSRAEDVAPPVGSAFDALIDGRDALPEAAPAAFSPLAETGPPETRAVRRPTIGPVDPVTAATQWTPGQTLGRLPY